MNMKNNSLPLAFLVIASVAVILFSCNKENNNGTTEDMSVASCEGCHINYAHLQKVYSPDTAVIGGGCGGAAPHYEPYDRVYMGGDGFEEYKKSGHYSIGCVGCHNGVDDTDDKNLAHSGDFLRHPSANAEEKCGTCHQEIVENFKTSIHNGTGQKRKVTLRSGLSGPEYFDQLPEHQIEGYNANCATCHGTCGNCHIVRPLAGGGGLADGHMFKRSPDMITTCVVCHSSRGGHAYLGVAAGTEADVHLTKMSFKCKACHSGAELHGDGNYVNQRYAYAQLPECEDCHTDITHANTYHSVHADDFNCQVCHSQDYNNCGSCHIHGEGARIPSYLDFKIAINPIPNVKKEFKFALVRRTLAAPDNWEKYGVEYASFDALPTYNYTTPHNLLRWTSRTQVPEGSQCSSSCHLRNEGGELINKGLYLWEEDLLDWEISATSHITVDGKLPSSWLEE
jgi:thiosulfate/3-mercaptopyruvate sulfurtransferase